MKEGVLIKHKEEVQGIALQPDKYNTVSISINWQGFN